MIKFISKDLWQTLSDLSKNSKNTKVAVAYLGTNASKRLKLKKNDVLVVAASLDNVRLGLVNPFELEIFFKKGVKIFNVKNLHSKIYIFDKKVIVGSPNVSNSSEKFLIESALITNDNTILKKSHEFINSLSIEEISKAYLKICKKEYRKPKFFDKDLIKASSPQFSKFWVVNTSPLKDNEHEEHFISQNKIKYEKKIKDKKTYSLGRIRYPYNNKFIQKINKGDLALEIYQKGSNTQVIEPQRVLGKISSKKLNCSYLLLEEKNDPNVIYWTIFYKKLMKNKINIVKKKSEREIKDDTIKRILLSFFKNLN